MAYRLSIGVNIDASGAKSGSAEAKQAVATIGTEADRAAPKVDNVADAVERVSNAGKSSPVPATIGAIGDAADRTRTKIQQLINASIGIHDGAANENARRWSGVLADEATSIDSLRAKYNPLFATIQRYKQVQMEIRATHAMGALSTDEFTAAMSRERQAALASIDAIKGRNRAQQEGAGGRQNQRFQSANLAFQVQDIVTTGAFMPWYTVALQQGPQVAAVMDSLENKSAGLASAFMSLVSPWSLLSIAAVGATAFAIQYFSTTSNEADKAAKAIERHNDLIRQIRSLYGEAAAGLGDYSRKTHAELEAAARLSLTAMQSAAREANKTLLDAIGDVQTPIRGAQFYEVEKRFKPFEDAIVTLRNSIRDGSSDFAGFFSEVNRIAATDPKGLRKLGDELIDSASKAADAQRGVQNASNAIDVLGGKASAQVAGVSQLTEALRELAGIAVPALSEAEQAQTLYQRAILNAKNREDKDFALQSLQEALRRIDNQNPRVLNSDGDFTNVPVPGTKPITLGDKPDKSIAASANAYRDLVKAADDRVAQMKLEAQLAGETGVAAEALRFKLDLLQQSEDKGRSLTPKQVEAINARVDAFKKYAEEAAKATLKADLLFEREQLGRSAFDQQIASSLRGAGLEVDFDSYEAGLIRTNLQLQYARDLTGDFVGTLFDGIQQGKGLWESLGDAAVNSLKRISETLLNDVLNSLFKVNSASAGGGSGGGLLGLLGNLFGFGSGSGASASSSPWSFGLDNWQFAGGGYTGPGGIHEPRGVVHAGEIVFSQRDVARNGGVAAVEAMRLGYRGYDNGGVVGVTPLMSPSMANRQSASAADRGMGTLKLLLGIAADGNGNIMPVIQQAIDKTVPGYIQMGIEDYDGRMPDRVAAINAEPWRR